MTRLTAAALGSYNDAFHDPWDNERSEATAMGIQHKRKELRTANKRRRKSLKNKLRSVKKYKK